MNCDSHNWLTKLTKSTSFHFIQWLPLWPAVLCFAMLTNTGCLSSTENSVVVYTALDREFSEPIFRDFTRETGIRVLPKFDTESTKTVGLYNAIVAESQRPRCDVFWNNEILNTLRLERAGLLKPQPSKQAENYPAMYYDSAGAWHGFAARARVLIVNHTMVDEEDLPRSIMELADEKWRGKSGIAKPLFGTTASHAAVLFHHLGREEAESFFRQVNENALIMSGNKRVAVAVARGQLAWGVTDTDDAIIELEKGMPVSILYPDQSEAGMGTLFIPNCLGIIRDCPHPKAAQKLVDFLLSRAVEDKLAAGASAQIPLRQDTTAKVRVETPQSVTAMEVDFEAAAEEWDHAAEFLQEVFAR